MLVGARYAVALGRLADRSGNEPWSFAVLQIRFAFFLPLCLFTAYASRIIVGAMPGEGVGLVTIFWSSFIILTPLALVDGVMFTFGSQTFVTLAGSEVPSIGKSLRIPGSYCWGIAFTYLLIPFFIPYKSSWRCWV